MNEVQTDAKGRVRLRAADTNRDRYTPLFVVGTENLTDVVLEQNQEELDTDKTQS